MPWWGGGFWGVHSRRGWDVSNKMTSIWITASCSDTTQNSPVSDRSTTQRSASQVLDKAVVEAANPLLGVWPHAVSISASKYHVKLTGQPRVAPIATAGTATRLLCKWQIILLESGGAQKLWIPHSWSLFNNPAGGKLRGLLGTMPTYDFWICIKNLSLG